MLLKINKKWLIHCVQIIAGVASKNEFKIDDLKSILFSVKNKFLYLYGTDGIVFLRITKELSDDENSVVFGNGEDEFCIPVQSLKDLIQTSKDKFIQFKSISKDKQVKMIDSDGQIDIARIDISKEFGILEDKFLINSDFPVKLKTSELLEALPQTSFCVSKNTERKAAITNLLIKKEDSSEKVFVAGTDGKRMSFSEISCETSSVNSFELLMPLKAIDVLCGLNIIDNIDDEIEVCFNKNSSKFMIKSKDIQYSEDNKEKIEGSDFTYEIGTQLFDGKFPNVKQIIPSDEKFSLCLDVDKDDFVRALKRAKVVSSDEKNSSCTFSIEEENLIISGAGQALGANSKVAIELKEKNPSVELPFNIKFNVNYWIELLRVSPRKTITIKFIDSESACVSNYSSISKSLIMPISD